MQSKRFNWGVHTLNLGQVALKSLREGGGEEVFFKMAENHCPILEMQSQKISLEEIFLELTEDNKKDSSDTDNRIQTAEEAEAVIRESENMTEEADKHDSSL